VGDRVSEFLVVGLGDSITAGNPGWDPDPARRPFEDPGDDETSQYLYWAARAHSGMRFRNHGVGGERTDEIRARLETAIVGADAIVVQGGINDVVQRRRVEQAAGNLEAMLDRGAAAGLALAVTDVLPWNNGDKRSAAAIQELNKLIGELADTTGATLLPFHDTLADPSDARRIRAGLTDDGDHPSIEGHRLLGERAFRLGPDVGQTSSSRPS